MAKKNITIRNFLRMTPDIPQYSSTNQHYLISGANPTYYLDAPGTQEEQYAPLAASNKWQQHTLAAGGTITDLTDDTESTYSAFSIDTTSTVNGINITGNSFTTLGQPSGSVVASNHNKVECYAGNLFAIVTNTASTLYRTPLPGGAWTSLGLISGTAEESFMDKFAEYLMISYSKSQVRKVNGAFSILTGIDLGTGWQVKGIRNYNDSYVAVAGANGNFTNNYLFLWNGTSDSYNYSVKMAGRYLDMKVIDGTLYVAVWVAGTGNLSGQGKTQLFYLTGTKLRPVLVPQISMINQLNGDKGCVFSIINRVGLNLDSTDLLVYSKEDLGEERFVISTGLGFSKFSETYDGFLIGSVGNGLYYYNAQSNTYNPIFYKSHWIDVQNLSGIDIVYDTPPQTGTDAINVTIYGRGEDIVTGSSTTVLQPIAAANPDSILNTSRTRLDVKGFTGDKLMIQLSTVNTGSWRPIIREINPI